MGVGTPTLTGVTLDPAGPVTLYDGDYVNFTATAHYSDGTTDPLGPVGGTGIHSPSTFSSDDETVATVSSGISFWGRAYGVAPGACTITVQLAFEDVDELHSASADVTVVDGPAHVVPNARFNLAFGHPTLQPYPDWTAIDTHPNLVTSYSIDRGRVYELDQTDAGRATVQILDPDGILDPTNPAGPHYGQIRPMLQALLCRHNPVTDTWEERYRGFVEDYAYDIDPSQQVNRLTISLVDMFDIVGQAQMQPGQFGSDVDGQIVYGTTGQLPGARITQILNDTGIPSRLTNIFRGNVHLKQATYSPGESPLTAIQETANAEFPGVGNVYCDRHGRVCFHGRYARFDPVTVAGIETEWDFHQWNAGDAAAVTASPSDTAQARALSFQRGVSKIINSGVALEDGAPDDITPSRTITDTTSVNTYGLRSWSETNLLTHSGDITLTHPTNAATETKRFAAYYVGNYAQPQNRIQNLQFKSLHPADPRGAANWDLLSRVDVSDTIEVTVATAGGGGFASEPYFIEGVHEDVKPLAPDYDDVTLTLDLSPRAYFTYDPWADPLTVADDPAPQPTRHKKPSPGKPGKPKPLVHGPDHSHLGPDPIPIHYENVGTPISGGGGTDLTGYIHYDSVGGPNSGGELTINSSGNINLNTANVMVPSGSMMALEVAATDEIFATSVSIDNTGTYATGGNAVNVNAGTASIGLNITGGTNGLVLNHSGAGGEGIAITMGSGTGLYITYGSPVTGDKAIDVTIGATHFEVRTDGVFIGGIQVATVDML